MVIYLSTIYLSILWFPTCIYLLHPSSSSHQSMNKNAITVLSTPSIHSFACHHLLACCASHVSVSTSFVVIVIIMLSSPSSASSIIADRVCATKCSEQLHMLTLSHDLTHDAFTVISFLLPPQPPTVAYAGLPSFLPCLLLLPLAADR